MGAIKLCIGISILCMSLFQQEGEGSLCFCGGFFFFTSMGLEWKGLLTNIIDGG